MMPGMLKYALTVIQIPGNIRSNFVTSNFIGRIRIEITLRED